MDDEKRIEVVYDRECPVCEFYCQRVDVQESLGRLERVDAREDSEVMTDITALGLDIDEGMVVRVGDDIHYGSDAIHELALLSSGKGFINRLASWTFRSRALSRILYPILKSIRNLLLKILGKSRINNLREAGNDRF